MADLDTLKSWETNNVTVEKILCEWYDVPSSDLMNSLCDDNSTIENWAFNNSIQVGDLIDWIETSLKHKAHFNITGGTDCEPVSNLHLGGGIILQLLWNFSIDSTEKP